MTSSLPELVARTARAFAARWKAVGAVTLVLGAIFAASAAFSALQTAQYRSRLLDDSAVQRDVELLHSLEAAARNGDTVAQRRIREVQSRVSARLSMLAGRRSPVRYWMETGPMLLLSAIVSLCVSLLAFAYGLAETVKGPGPWRTLVEDAVRLLPRMALLLLAMIGLSLLWIPAIAVLLARLREAPLGETATMVQTLLVFTGYLVAVSVVPRIALAPAVLAVHGGSVQDAIRGSLDATRGHWGKVLGNLLSVFVGLVLASWLILAVLESVAGRNSILLALPKAFLLQAGIVVMGAFLPRLLQTLKENPMEENEELKIEN